MRLGAYNKSSADELGNRLVTIDMPKSGGAAVPLLVGRGAGFLSNTMSPGPRLTSVPMVPSDILIHPTFWPGHRSYSIQKTVTCNGCQKNYKYETKPHDALHHGKLNVLQTKVDAQCDKSATELT